MINDLIHKLEVVMPLLGATAEEQDLVLSSLTGLLHHDTYMANELIKQLRQHIDTKAHLIGGFGRRKGKYSETHTDIDVQLSVKRTKGLELRLLALLKPRSWVHTDWVPKGLYLHRTAEFGNVDLFFPDFS